MKDNNKTKELLLKELTELRQRIIDLEKEKNKLNDVKHTLVQSEKRYRDTIESISDGLFVLTEPDLTVTYINAAAERITHRKAADVVGKPLFDTFHEARGSIFEKNYRRAIKERKFISFENYIGEVDYANWYEVRVFPTKEGITVFFQAVTERKKGEESLRLFRSLIDKSNDSIFLINPETSHILDVNEKSCDELGYSRKELLEMKITDIEAILPDEFSWKNHVIKLKETGTMLLEGIHKRKDGSTFPTEINISFVHMENKDFMVAVARSTIERQKLQEELRRSHKLESIGILAGGIAHDFNNLLTAMTNNIYLAEKRIDRTGDAFDLLERVRKSISIASNLTYQLLTFAKGGSPVKETASIVNLIRGNAEFTLRESNVKCNYTVPENLWTVEVDSGQMSQVIQNLIINAYQSMPEGGILEVAIENVLIDSEAHVPASNGKYVKVVFTDHGTGISEDHLQKIFDPFFTTKDMGRGLGLAVTHSIIKNHEGHISVASRIGEGTTFTIYLPATEKQIAGQTCYENIPFKGEGKILIMDDDEMVRDSLGQMLEVAGYSVEFAKDGNEAIETFKKAKELSHPFDAVILDLTIPGGMGGKEAMIKLFEIDPEVKGIVSSGYATDPLMSDFEKYGFRGVIKKPYNVPELFKVLHQAVKQ